MEKIPVKFSVVDAFTDTAFKGNPAAVCLLEEEKDEEWLQAVAMEFNISETCYLTCIHNHADHRDQETAESKSNPRFHLRSSLLASGQIVAELEPQFDELLKCSAAGVIITGSAPHGSEFDFFSRFFCPKLCINEDPVCGSAHCALAPYWSKKLGKYDFLAYMASPRGGVLDLHLEEDTQRVKIRGNAVTVMEGSVFA
ncbi:hypothetical protein MKX01_018209 [Papaver californicum]|nr:hypothetical protein MKX01_018209 [Papaver californicum]